MTAISNPRGYFILGHFACHRKNSRIQTELIHGKLHWKYENPQQ